MVLVVKMNHLMKGDIRFLTTIDWGGIMFLITIDWAGVHGHFWCFNRLYCNFLNHCTKQLINAQQFQGEAHNSNMIMIIPWSYMIMVIPWSWQYSPMDSSTVIPTISQPLAIKFAYMFEDLSLRFVHKFAHISLSLLPFSAFLLLGLVHIWWSLLTCLWIS
jgi:hypothetical protein